MIMLENRKEQSHSYYENPKSLIAHNYQKQKNAMGTQIVTEIQP